LKQANRRRKK